MLSFKAGLVFAALVNAAAAQTTLYIPGLDDQAVSANVLGTGADGTTWLLQPASSVDPENADGLVGPATLIAGPSTVKIIYDLPGGLASGQETCQIDGAVANCEAVIVEGSRTLTNTLTETVAPMTVLGGGPLSGSSAPAASTPASSAGGSSAPSGASDTASATTPSATAPPPATSDNGVGKLGSNVVPLAIAVGAGVFALF